MLTEGELRERIRQMILEKIEEVEILSEKKTNRKKKRKNLTDLTKLMWRDQNTYKGKIRRALTKAHGHIDVAADSLGVSGSTLKRHIDKNFGDGEIKTAPPGPDPLFDTEVGDWEKTKSKN
jgi:transcriptional regulator with PAS, ATPase and Fis domain